MKAITVTDLGDYFEQQDYFAANGQSPEDAAADEYWTAREAEIVAAMTAQEHLDYMVHNGDLAHCRACGARYVETWMHPYDPESHLYAECCGAEVRPDLPDTAYCYECGGEHKVVEDGPVVNRADPTATYRLDCGHLAI